MKKLQLIIYREFKSKVNNKSFVILTFLSPFLVIGMGMLIYYLSALNGKDVKEIVLVDQSALMFKDVFLDNPTEKYLDFTDLGLEQSKELVRQHKYSGLLYIPPISKGVKHLAESMEFFSEETPSLPFLSALESKIEERLKLHKLSLSGVTSKTISEAHFDVDLIQVNFSGEQSSKLGNGLRIGLGLGAGYLVMMFIVVYGNSVMRSVIEEKTSRIIEIVISSVKPFQLMLGKIVGNAMAGLLQFFIWGILLVLLGLLARFFTEGGFGTTPSSLVAASNIEMPAQNSEQSTLILKEIAALPLFQMFVMFVFYFLGGFFFYSAIYAAIGAAVNSETDTQQFLLPVLLPLMLAVYVGIVSVVDAPHGPVATVFSILPFTSSIVMLMRIPFGVPWWELLLSMALLLISFVGMVLFAAKIYRIGILMYGKKPSYKDLYKWLQY
jgi:ABC-2 type transport system permease protein